MKATELIVIDNRDQSGPDFVASVIYDSGGAPAQTPLDDYSNLRQNMAALGLGPTQVRASQESVIRLRLLESAGSPYRIRLGNIQVGEAHLLGAVLAWPPDVVDQLLFHHGARLHIDEQFGHLDLLTLRWDLETHQAGELAGASYHPDKTRVDTVSAEPERFVEEYSQKGHTIWTDTWNPEPIFIDGELLHPAVSRLHLMEGHSRLGILRGLTTAGTLAPSSNHRCWVCRSAN